MKLQPDRLDGVNAVHKLTPTQVHVGALAYEHHVLIPWTGPVAPWNAKNWAQLTADDFLPVVALQPELVILGSGAQLKFPPAHLLQSLMAQRIGFESMDSHAACRTYNVLAGEGRKVVLALLLPALA